MSDEPAVYLHFCNGCGLWYTTKEPGPVATYDTGEEPPGVLEFHSEACRDEWLAQPTTH